MKCTLNTKELKTLNACSGGYDKFKSAHGDKTVTLTEAFKSNGWDDIWWYIENAHKCFSDVQKKDLRLLAADYAERVLPIFEKNNPDDDRPRKAIKAARYYANGLIDDSSLDAARAAVRDAVMDAAGSVTMYIARAARAAAMAAGSVTMYTARAAGSAAMDAARAAGAAAGDAGTVGAAIAAARDYERKWQEEKLLELFAKWEKSNESNDI